MINFLFKMNSHEMSEKHKRETDETKYKIIFFYLCIIAIQIGHNC